MKRTEKKQNVRPIDDRPFVTIRDCPARTGLSERYIRQLKRDGKLPCIMSGNRCLVNVPQLMELMNEKTLKAIV
ncbi:MAG: hypothetical protein IKO25_00315 [Clostridia bacterium]|nr:hypothetical protein [Clostridia bacterium]